jgi:hypothetical protein
LAHARREEELEPGRRQRRPAESLFFSSSIPTRGLNLALCAMSGVSAGRSELPNQRPYFFPELLQLSVFRFRLHQDGDVGIGALPEGEEVLVMPASQVVILAHFFRSPQSQIGQGTRIHFRRACAASAWLKASVSVIFDGLGLRERAVKNCRSSASSDLELRMGRCSIAGRPIRFRIVGNPSPTGL